MEIDVSLSLRDSIDGRRRAARAEDAGFSGAWVSEVAHDPFLALATCALGSERLSLGTAVAVALARSPMTVAVQAHDLQRLSGGRLRLGLGSQVRAHVTRRFSMPWDQPVERMREFVAAVRAIWMAWEQERPLRFEGDFYAHTLMPPAFRPAPTGHGLPPILLSGVGRRMTRMAGATGDGFICHAFTTPGYLREVTVPELRDGRGTDDLASYELVAVQMVATGADERELTAAIERVREQIAFYAATASYRPVLEHHGHARLGEALRQLARAGRWEQMPSLVPDELLTAVAVVAEPERVLDAVRNRHAGVASRVSLYAPGGFGDAVLTRIGAS